MHVDVLDCDTLLALATVTVEGVGQRCIGAGELMGLVQVFAPRLEALLGNRSFQTYLASWSWCASSTKDPVIAHHPHTMTIRLSGFC